MGFAERKGRGQRDREGRWWDRLGFLARARDREMEKKAGRRKHVARVLGRANKGSGGEKKKARDFFFLPKLSATGEDTGRRKS